MQGLQVRDRNRETYSAEDVQWADTIISAGGLYGWTHAGLVHYLTHLPFAGDGNFLFTASKVFSSDKLIVGVNTDPSR